MICKKCGTTLNDKDILCPGCGSRVEEVKTEKIENIKIDNNSNITITDDNIKISNETTHSNQDIMPIDIKNNKKLDTSPIEKKSKKKYLIILLVIILIISSIYIGYAYAKSYIKKTKMNVTYDIHYKNYVVSVLNRYVYDTSNIEKGFLTFSDDINNYVVLININEGNYNNLKDEYLKLKPIIENQGLIVKNITKKTLYNKDYIAVEIVNHGEEQILMYTNLDDNNLITLLLINKNHTYDYTYVKNITPLIKNIKKSNNNETFTNNEFILVDISTLTN